MSEVYRNSTSFVYLDIYGDVADTTPTAVCLHTDGTEQALVVQGPETINDAQRWTAVAGFEHTQEVGELRVVWAFSINAVDASKTDFLDVVIPLVEIGQARVELEIPDEISDDKIVLTERRVRRVIERCTGQVFSPSTQTLIGTELEDGSVRLPQRLLSLTGVGGVQNSLYYVLADTGWRLAIVYPRKRTGIRAGEVPIVDPFARYRRPHINKVMVTGRWGYERVPSDVEEAALILMEQYLCPDAIYAERYLKTMTAADFRFEFDTGAYRGTGNVIADHLLAKYWAHSAAVI